MKLPKLRQLFEGPQRQTITDVLRYFNFIHGLVYKTSSEVEHYLSDHREAFEKSGMNMFWSNMPIQGIDSALHNELRKFFDEVDAAGKKMLELNKLAEELEKKLEVASNKLDIEPGANDDAE